MSGRVLVILDGAPEPVQPWPTTLEAAEMPALAWLCAEGTVGRLATTPAGHEPGSETGIPALLGALPAGPAGRGPIEAAAAGVAIPEGADAWRLDVRHPDGTRATGRDVLALWPLLRACLPEHRLVPLLGHRLLAVGARRPRVDACAEMTVTVWPDGERLPAGVAPDTTMICGPGAAAGIGRLLGAEVVVPAGATGDVDSDLDAKADAAVRALDHGRDVVIHVGGADEAAHRRERDAKREVLEAADARLVARLRRAARRAGAVMTVTSDHGTCPWTGRHDASPVPFVIAGPGVPAYGPRELTERAVADCPVDVPAGLEVAA